MQLKLRVTSAQSQSLGREASAHFQLRGGTLGRARDNDWILPDPERVISSHHARILYNQEGYFIEDTSTNGTYLNQAETPLPRGEAVALNHGDRIVVGEYEIQVELIEDSPRPHPPGMPGRDDQTTTPSAADFIAEPYRPDSSRAPWDIPKKAFLAETDAWRAEPLPPSPAVPASPPEGPSRSDHLPADRQYFRPPQASPERIKEEIPPPVEEVLPDDWWNAEESPVASAPGPPPAAEQVPTDWAEPPAAPAPRVQPPSARERAPSPADLEPDTTPSPVELAEEEAEAVAPPDSQSAERLVAAFFAGLGLPPPPAVEPARQEAQFRQLGRLMRLLTQGTIEVLQARSTLKGEFRLSQTIVRPAENNPLKFSLTANQALEQLFSAPRPGFLSAEAAFAEALQDIRHHELAVVAGMRAAFNSLLRKLSPEMVEAAFRAHRRHGLGLFGDRFWNFYKEYHADFQANAGDDFQGIFGQDFVRAYEEQLARLNPRKSGPHS